MSGRNLTSASCDRKKKTITHHIEQTHCLSGTDILVFFFSTNARIMAGTSRFVAGDKIENYKRPYIYILNTNILAMIVLLVRYVLRVNLYGLCKWMMVNNYIYDYRSLQVSSEFQIRTRWYVRMTFNDISNKPRSTLEIRVKTRDNLLIVDTAMISIFQFELFVQVPQRSFFSKPLSAT